VAQAVSPVSREREAAFAEGGKVPSIYGGSAGEPMA